MNCLVFIYDRPSIPLLEVAANITGYHLQPSVRSIDFSIAKSSESIVPIERGFFNPDDLPCRDAPPTGSAFLTINLRCLNPTSKRPCKSELGLDSSRTLDDSQVFDHEYLYTQDRFQSKDFCRFLSFITGQFDPLSSIRNKKRTAYIGLTYSDVRVALPNMTIVSVGADALELRVDLLGEGDRNDGPPDIDYVAEQVMATRLGSELPIIFCIRLVPSGGRWSVTDLPRAIKYLRKALQWGVDFIDVEYRLENLFREKLIHRKRYTRVIASYHDFSGRFNWAAESTKHIYRTSAMYGDVVQIAALSNGMSDAFDIQRFRESISIPGDDPTAPNPPVIAFNTGRSGKLSRILNPFLQATTHHVLPSCSAPDQLSLVDVNGALAVLGELPRKKIYVFHDNESDAELMNKCFNELALPHIAIGVAQRQDLALMSSILREPECGGAVFKFTSAQNLGSELRLKSMASKYGTIDTISTENGNLVGHDCLAMGIQYILTQESAPSAFKGKTVLIVGHSFLESSSVIHALLSLGCDKLLILGFTVPRGVTDRAVDYKTVFSHTLLHPVAVISTVAPQDSAFLPPLIQIIARKYGLIAGRVRPLVFLDLQGSQKDAAPMVSRTAGWITITREHVAAAVTVMRLRTLVDEKIPYDFVRMVKRRQLY